MDLARVGEDGFVEAVRHWVGAGSARAGSDDIATGVLGIGDDAAVAMLSEGCSVVASCDVLVDQVHFRLDWSSPADVGTKAVAVNVSDLAAMGATPRLLLVGLTIPPTLADHTLEGLYDGMTQACAQYGCVLAGGDTVRGPALQLAVTAIGEVAGPPLVRSGARPGDTLAVTGPLGRAATGVTLLMAGPGASPAAIEATAALACIERHCRPAARVSEGIALRAAGAHAAMDLSDGLYADVRRMAAASHVGVELIVGAAIADEVRRVADARGWDAERLAYAGGEDYELLVAVPPGFASPVPLIEVGRVTAAGLTVRRDGRTEPLPEGGYDHFRTA